MIPISEWVKTLKQYEHSKHEKLILEHIKVPFAVYQYVNKRVVALILSDGFCSLFGYDERMPPIMT